MTAARPSSMCPVGCDRVTFALMALAARQRFA